jgi:hypothetical protein
MANKNFKKDEIVVCVINWKASLTLFHEYKVEDVTYSGELLIENDSNDPYFYNEIRFIKKSDMREIKINKILNNLYEKNN